MLQLLRGIEYIHREGYTHRDLKPENILVTEWHSKTDFPTVKLADFGLAGINSTPVTICGTRGYVAPEIEAEETRQKTLQRREAKGFETIHQPYYYDSSVDIWALGKILKELTDGLPTNIRVRGKAMPVRKEPAMQLVALMMNSSPKERPTASECLQHPWLVEDNAGASKKHRLPTSSVHVAPPSKRVRHNTSWTTVSGKDSTQILVDLLFSEHWLR